MKPRLLAGLMAGLLLLSACSTGGAYQKRQHFSFRSESPAEPLLGSNIISDKNTLRLAIINAVRSRKEKEELTIQSYDGEWEADLEAIRSYIREEYPYGRYAVESISSDSSKIFTQTRLNLYIQYRDSAFDLGDIAPILDINDFERQVTELLTAFEMSAGSDKAMSKAYFFYSIPDSDALLDQRLIKCWANQAGQALDLRSIGATAYPDGEGDRIVEVNIQYLENRETLLAKSRELARSAKAAAAGFSGGSAREKVDYVYAWLWEHVQFDPTLPVDHQNKIDRLTAYGGLVGQRAAQPGYTLAAQVLCRQLELDSFVLVGEAEGYGQYYWLAVPLEEGWMFFDPAAMHALAEEIPATPPTTEEPAEDQPPQDPLAGHQYLFTLEEGIERYSWNREIYNFPDGLDNRPAFGYTD